MDLNKKPIFLAADFDFATEEMCSFQDRSVATETPQHGQAVTHFQGI